jgi:hypothetical protein
MTDSFYTINAKSMCNGVFIFSYFISEKLALEDLRNGKLAVRQSAN